MNNTMHKELLSEQKFRNKITVLSFVASILVIYIHADNMTAYSLTEKSEELAGFCYSLEMFFNRFSAIAVPIFFIISGILFYRTFDIHKLWDKYRSRFSSILIPYLIWASLYYAYFIIVTRIPAIVNIMNSAGPVEISISNYFNWLWSGAYYTLWFLKNLIVFILLTPIIWVALNNHIKKIPTGLLVLVLLYLVSRWRICGIILPEGMLYYLIGSYIGLNCKNGILISNKYVSYASVVYILAIVLTGFSYWNLGLELLFYGALWYAIDLLIDARELPWYMYISFFTYVSHDIVLQGIKKICLKLLGKDALWALLSYILIPLIVEIILIWVAYIMKRFLPKLWKLLIGGRNVGIRLGIEEI